MIFNKSNCLIKNKAFKLHDQIIKQVKEFTYLGTVFTQNGNFKNNQLNLRKKAMKALFSIRKSILEEKMVTPALCIKLFDTLIVPILSYGSEIWASEISSDDNSLEKLCTSYYRFVLGVSKRTPLAAIRGELGRFPIRILLTISVLKYWFRLTCLTESDILKKAFNENIKCESSWINFITRVTGSCYQRNVFKSFSVKSKFQLFNRVQKKLEKDYIDSWMSQLYNDKRKSGNGNKLRTYRVFKSNFTMENYLHDISDFRLRRCITMFRVSDHNLEIELGRKKTPKVPLHERICRRCDMNEIDDEWHLIFSCTKFTKERKHLYKSCDVIDDSHTDVYKRKAIIINIMNCNILPLAIFLKNTNCFLQ